MVGEGGGRKRSRESLGLDNGANGGRSLLSVCGTGALTPNIYLQHRERRGGAGRGQITVSLALGGHASEESGMEITLVFQKLVIPDEQ